MVVSEQYNSSHVTSGLIIQQANTHHLLDLFEEVRLNVKSPELASNATAEPLVQQPTISEVKK